MERTSSHTLAYDVSDAPCMPAPEVAVMCEQESLTDELLGMSAALKRNALAMQQGVANRGAILEETDDSIEHNLAMQQKSVKKSKEEYRRSFSCTSQCMTNMHQESFYQLCTALMPSCITYRVG